MCIFLGMIVANSFLALIFFCFLCTNLGINRTQTTAYHPEVERFNRTLKAMLSKEIEEHQKDWEDHLQKVLFVYRTAVHDTTGYTAYFIIS